jgi:hypothetical protein
MSESPFFLICTLVYSWKRLLPTTHIHELSVVKVQNKYHSISGSHEDDQKECSLI